VLLGFRGKALVLSYQVDKSMGVSFSLSRIQWSFTAFQEFSGLSQPFTLPAGTNVIRGIHEMTNLHTDVVIQISKSFLTMERAEKVYQHESRIESPSFKVTSIMVLVVSHKL
jgi:hypothetical protein